ncbi:hypothetical protein [Leifsonia sp. Le1]|uniref:hypothetical protein n=1 Tax=Leifsonia sp. Le1 TaxID=3404918 RepID=UPI003EBCD5A1
MNPNTLSYNHAHDEARRQLRRHERDLQWAKDRRRQQERELAEARALLAASPATLVWTPLTIAAVLLVADAVLVWGVLNSSLLGSTGFIAVWAGAAFAAIVIAKVTVSLVRLHGRRRAARKRVQVRDARLAHTQFHIEESLASFIDGHQVARATR